MDDYIRLGILVAVAVILLGLLIRSRKRSARSEDVPMVFPDLKDDFDREFLMKQDPHTHDERLAMAIEQYQSVENTSDTANQDPLSTQSMSYHPNLLTLAVMAKPGHHFASYDLLQAISSAGLQFGAMNIFHYYQEAHGNKIALFSLASANEPGDFDLNHIGEFSCSGLVLFMKFTRISDPHSAFKIMLDVAEHLAEDLDGELKADPFTPWTSEMSRRYQEKIIQAQSVETELFR